VRAHRTPQQVVKRCQIILRSAEGKSDEAIAKELDINRHTCRLWRERFASCGADCLWEVEAGRGRKSQAGLAQRIIEATLHSKPTGQTHWTTRKMAKEHGVHASTLARICQEHELKPHRQKSFKLWRKEPRIPIGVWWRQAYLSKRLVAILFVRPESASGKL
jgi:transposase